jgi:integrase
LTFAARAGELATLTADSFDLKAGVVSLPASATKNGLPARQPIIDKGYTKVMRRWLKNKVGPLWPGNWWQRAAEMLEHDLGSVGVDFHCLRVTYVTRLCQAGYTPKTVQILARHSTLDLTMRIYTKYTESDVEREVRTIAAQKPSSLRSPSCPLDFPKQTQEKAKNTGKNKRKAS